MKRQLSPIYLLLLLAIMMRLFLLIRSHGVIDGDEALVGIQAQHILQGEHPVYFYGIAYFGSLEAYLLAGLFALVGSSVWALHTLPVLASTLLVWLTWLLAGELATFTGLSTRARTIFMSIAAFLAAVPPVYDVLVEMRTWGGHIEVYIIMLALLYCAVRLVRAWPLASRRVIAVWWLAIGFLAGLGLWVYPIEVLALGTIVLWIAGYCIIFTWCKRQILATLQRLALAVLAIPAFIIGFLPALLWGKAHQWANIKFILNLGVSSQPLDERLYHFSRAGAYFTSCTGPRVIGGMLPGMDGLLPFENHISIVNKGLLLFGISCIVASLCIIAVSLLPRASSLLKSLGVILAMPVIFGTLAILAFCSGSMTVSGLVSDSCNIDFVGRYAVPLVLVLPFFGAATLTIGIEFLRTRLHQGRAFSVYLPHIMLLVVLGSYLCAQTVVYRRINAPVAFQSPYCGTAPLDSTPIINYIESQGIRYAWAPNLLGYTLMFKSNGRIAIADPITVNDSTKQWLNRLPSVTNTPLQTERPAFITVQQKADPTNVPLLQRFAQWGIPYKVAFFPASQGAYVMVTIPLRRTFPVDTLTTQEHSWFGCWPH